MGIQALDIMRIVTASCWLLVFLVLSGSILRMLFSKHRTFDPLWAIFWFISLRNMGYAVRWVTGWVYIPVDDGDLASLLGLQLLSCLIAVAVLRQRKMIDGVRW